MKRCYEGCYRAGSVYASATLTGPREALSEIRPPLAGNLDVARQQLTRRQAADKPNLALKIIGMLLEFLLEIKEQLEAVTSAHARRAHRQPDP